MFVKVFFSVPLVSITSCDIFKELKRRRHMFTYIQALGPRPASVRPEQHKRGINAKAELCGRG